MTFKYKASSFKENECTPVNREGKGQSSVSRLFNRNTKHKEVQMMISGTKIKSVQNEGM